MASTSTSNSDAIAGRILNTASTLVSENQSLILEIRRAVTMMKNIAVDMERDNQSEMVQNLEKAVAELLETYSDCTRNSSAIQSVANAYQPSDELTDFKKLLEDESAKLKATPIISQNDQLMRQFKEAVWKVHHEGMPMPGDEQEDIVMTSTQSNLLNITCPLSGKPITELADPVRSVECKHIYDKAAIIHYISKQRNKNASCPVAGCPKKVQKDKVVCDPLLKIEIEDLRSMNKQAPRSDVIEDFTELVDED